MIKFVDEVLMSFKICFSRKKTFSWFIVAIIGLMARNDGLGVTSIMRSLLVKPKMYTSLLALFRSKAWTLDKLMQVWWSAVKTHAPVMEIDGYTVAATDGIKKSKEGQKMPGTKTHHQESANSSKAPYIWGHLFGAVGVLASNGTKTFCIPMALTIQDGVRNIFKWVSGWERQGSHVVETITLSHKITSVFGKVLLLMDSYFMTVPALERLDALNIGGELMNIIAKAKNHYTAYREPPPRRPGQKGQPAKRGERVKLCTVFEELAHKFEDADVIMYDKPEKVKIYSENLLWGQGYYKKLRFVFVIYNEIKTVLMCTDTKLEPATIAQLYCKRFKIECMFREMSQVVYSFNYRFWSKSMPKLSKRKKKTTPDPMKSIKDTETQGAIINTVKAIEGYVFCCAVATGLLQMSSLLFSSVMEFSKFRFLRVRRNTTESEATVAEYFRRRILLMLVLHPDLPTCEIIRAHQVSDLWLNDNEVAV